MNSSLEPNRSLEARILDWVFRDDYRPAKPRQLHKSLGLSEEDYPLLRKTLKRMVQQGKLAFAANHLIRRPEPTPTAASAKNQRSGPRSPTNQLHQGIFRASSERYGFVRLDQPDAEIVADEIFIPAKATGSAMDGDRVAIRLLPSSASHRSEGQVEEIVHRARRQFVGTYQVIEKTPVVWLDGVRDDRPVMVGDVRGLPLSTNDKVIVEMVRYPDAFHPGEGVILRILGSSQNPAVDTFAVMEQFGLVDTFPDAVMDEARSMADRFEEGVPADREDLTQVPTLTIDPFDARDFDDAISLTINEAGHWELQVHIADVTHFVPAGSALDEEAQQRGTSVYLPDRVIPMLPEIISNHLASLQPDRLRYAKTVLIEITPEGTVLYTRVFNSVIKNQQRLNYEQVDQFLQQPDAWRERLSPAIFELLARMHQLAMMLRQRRMQGGSIELTLPEVKIELDKGGKVKGAHLVHHTESHQVIEELMLAANQAIATYLDRLNIPFLRRAHAPPQRIKLKRLYEFVKGLGIECGDLQNRFEIQRVIQSVRGKPTELAVNYAVLKSMSKAVYQPQVERHYALDMTHYCHFTSPIRRYPDLLIHRTIQKIIDQQNAIEPIPLLTYLGQHCSDREVNAENAERELIRVKLLHYMSRKVGQAYHGTVSSVKADELLIRLEEIPVDGVLLTQQLPPDRYRFDRETHTLEGFRSGNRFRLGDRLEITVKEVDLARRKLFFSLVPGAFTGKNRSPAASPSGRGPEDSSPRNPSFTKRKDRRQDDFPRGRTKSKRTSQEGRVKRKKKKRGSE